MLVRGEFENCRRLASSDGAYDEKRLGTGGDGVRKRCVGLLVREILAAGEKAQEGPAQLRDVIADGAAEHRVAGFEGVENGALRDLAGDLEFDFAANVREASQVRREYDANHASVWTSTESTAGRSRTIGAQLSPPSGET